MPKKGDKICPTCMGTGYIYKIIGRVMTDEKKPCPDCKGKKWIKVVIPVLILLMLLLLIK